MRWWRYRRARRRVEVDPGDVEIRAGESTWHVQVAPGVTMTVEVGSGTLRSDQAGSKRQERKWIAYTLGGTGIATGALGVTLGLIARHDYDAQFTSGHCLAGPSQPSLCDASGRSQVERAVTMGKIGTGLAVTSVLALGAAAVVYLTAPSERVVVTPTASASAGGLVVSGSF